MTTSTGTPLARRRLELGLEVAGVRPAVAQQHHSAAGVARQQCGTEAQPAGDVGGRRVDDRRGPGVVVDVGHHLVDAGRRRRTRRRRRVASPGLRRHRVIDERRCRSAPFSPTDAEPSTTNTAATRSDGRWIVGSTRASDDQRGDDHPDADGRPPLSASDADAPPRQERLEGDDARAAATAPTAAATSPGAPARRSAGRPAPGGRTVGRLDRALVGGRVDGDHDIGHACRGGSSRSRCRRRPGRRRRRRRCAPRRRVRSPRRRSAAPAGARRRRATR